MAKAVPFLVRLPPDLKRRLAKLAKLKDDSEARQLREALREYLIKHEQPAPAE